MNNNANYKLEQLVNERQLHNVRTLSEDLKECFKTNATIDYRTDTNSSLVFKIMNKTPNISNSSYCIYLTRILEFGEVTLDYFVCRGLDTVAIVLMSFKELIYLGDLYCDNFVPPNTTHTLFRGEEHIE